MLKNKIIIIYIVDSQLIIISIPHGKVQSTFLCSLIDFLENDWYQY